MPAKSAEACMLLYERALEPAWLEADLSALRISALRAAVCLQSRGCPLRGIWGTKDLAAQKQRFLDNGWQRAKALDMHTVYGRHVDALQRRRSAVVLPCHLLLH